ncbi:MAG: DNA-deoxyinosine glycosylase [Alphaproteobacteria bacterium]|nr:DNA-deoxyinosine glycosylase [Alphaproteobacteria bacterium]
MLESFTFIANQQTKILIIGSMPGIASLRAQEYYAHPQNLFWKFVFKACCVDYNFPTYNEKIAVLSSHCLGLWDVVKNCAREGSLDCNIKEVIPNDFYFLTNCYPNILKFLFNGQKAFKLFKTFYPELLIKKQYAVLPSTSPANASIPFKEKESIWINSLISI